MSKTDQNRHPGELSVKGVSRHLDSPGSVGISSTNTLGIHNIGSLARIKMSEKATLRYFTVKGRVQQVMFRQVRKLNFSTLFLQEVSIKCGGRSARKFGPLIFLSMTWSKATFISKRKYVTSSFIIFSYLLADVDSSRFEAKPSWRRNKQ
jgi:hypothetical protein